MIRSTPLPPIPAIAAFIAGGIVLSTVAVAAVRTTSVSTAKPMRLSELGHRVLVIAPHPDDEILATGGTIRRLVAEGADVKVVVVTAGDSYRRAAARISGGPAVAASYLELGNIRHQECLTAARHLGLAEDHVVALGFADGTTLAMWDRNWDASHPAEGRNGATQVPYAWAADPGTALCGDDLVTRLESIIREFAPDTVITPDVHETHPDHSTVAAFATYAMDAEGFAGRRLSTVVHFRHYPYPWAHLPGSALNPPPQLVGDGTEWLALPLSQVDEEAKAAAIADYRSQTAIADLGLYMRAFVRTNELFAQRPPATLAVLSTDDRPGRADATTVSVTPQPVVPSGANTLRPRIAGILMVRGPHVVWVGLRCDRRVTADGAFRLGLRLFGDGAPGRLDVSVHDTTATVLRLAANSIVPDGVRAEADGDTVWVSIPASALAGRTRCMIGAMAGREGGSPMRTAWREVDL